MDKRQAVLEEMEGVRRQTLDYLETLTQAELDWQPPEPEGEEAWSLGEVFMHLAIDEFYVRELISRPLLTGIKPPEGVRFLPPPPPHGWSKDVIRYWFERARAGTRRLFAEWPADANLALKHEGGLREMSGLEWFRGYASHEAFHHRQINTLRAQLKEGDI